MDLSWLEIIKYAPAIVDTLKKLKADPDAKQLLQQASDPATGQALRLAARMAHQLATTADQFDPQIWTENVLEFLFEAADILQSDDREKMRASLFLVGADGEQLVLAVGTGHDTEDRRTFNTQGDALAARCYRQTKGGNQGFVASSNVWQEHYADKTRLGGRHDNYRGVVVAGICNRDGCAAVLSIDTSRKRQWTSVDELIIRALASAFVPWLQAIEKRQQEPVAQIDANASLQANTKYLPPDEHEV